jgi:hypothetical protein
MPERDWALVFTSALESEQAMTKSARLVVEGKTRTTFFIIRIVVANILLALLRAKAATKKGQVLRCPLAKSYFPETN